MKRLTPQEVKQVPLEVLECDCGFRLGVDANWLAGDAPLNGGFEAIGWFEINCPQCGDPIPVEKLLTQK